MMLFRIRVEIFEPSRPFPVVVHEFLGERPNEAEGYYRAHLESDSFLRQCVQRGVFRGRVRCRPVVSRDWIDWIERPG